MRFIGNGVVWDKDANCPLAIFVGGTFETDNAEVIKKLKALDYGGKEDKKPVKEA